MTQTLPRGIYYEKARDRYRVRLYRGATVVFREYFKTLAEAEEGLARGHKLAADAVPEPPPGDLVHPVSQLAALRTKTLK